MLRPRRGESHGLVGGGFGSRRGCRQCRSGGGSRGRCDERIISEESLYINALDIYLLCLSR